MSVERRPVKRTRRIRTTHPRVRIAEVLSRVIITVGGLGTILAVTLICGFLVWVAAPLFFGSELDPGRPVNGLGTGPDEETGADHAELRVLHGSVDEYGLLAWSVLEDGSLRVARLDSGELLEERALLGGAAPTSSAFDRQTERVAFGFADGTVRLGSLGFRSRFLREDEASETVRRLHPGEVANFAGGVVQRTAEGTLRTQELAVHMEDPVDLGGSADALGSAAIEAIDITQVGSESMFVVLTAADRLALFGASQRENLMTGEIVTSLREGELPYAPALDGSRPQFLGLGGSGAEVYLIWEDGRCVRYDVRNLEQGRVAEELDLVPEPEVLLLDEPCSALDPIATGRIEDLIEELKGSYSVLMVTHNMQQASRTSDYTAFMYLGRLVEYGPTNTVFMQPRREETENYVTGRFG